MTTLYFKNLREKAIKILNPGETVKYNQMLELTEELCVQQVELELQNITLLETQSQYEDAYIKYKELFDLAPIGYFIINPNGLILEVNKAGAELLGIEKYMLNHRTLSRYVAPESQFIFSEYRQQAFKETTLQQCELKLLKRNAPLFYAKLTGKTIIGSDLSKKLLITITDITRYKHENIEDKLQSENKLISVITNELNHHLGIISNFLYGCIRRLENGDHSNTILSATKQATQQLNYASTLILRLKNFFYKGTLDCQSICVNEMIEEVITLINNEQHEKSISVYYKKNNNISNIIIDKLHIQYVILNLARNAIEAMQDAKTSNPKLTIEVNYFNKNIIEICVSDNGPGFSSEVAQKLFDPNFTTKPYGIGLGLTISRIIIEAHGGKLLFNASPANETCFKFTLPFKTH